MSFFEVSKMYVFLIFREMIIWGSHRRPTGLLDGPHMILGHWQHANDSVCHQASLTRPLKAVVAACSTTILCKCCQKSMKNIERKWQALQINGKPMQTDGKPMKILDLEVEQAPTTASRGRVSGA